jgi:O-antigen/teichoic acid export membrane protein
LPLLFKGLVFGSSAVLNRINSDVDKLMLTALAGPAVTGVYSVAYRIANTATLVPSSVVSAWSPRIVRLASGIAAPGEIDFARVGRMIALTGLATGMAVATLAPALSFFLEQEFAVVVRATVLLAWLPLVIALRFRDGMVLIGAERSAARSRVLAVATVLNVALNLALIPRFEVYGAIVATLASELFVLFSFRVIGRSILAGAGAALATRARRERP